MASLPPPHSPCLQGLPFDVAAASPLLPPSHPPAAPANLGFGGGAAGWGGVGFNNGRGSGADRSNTGGGVGANGGNTGGSGAGGFNTGGGGGVDGGYTGGGYGADALLFGGSANVFGGGAADARILESIKELEAAAPGSPQVTEQSSTRNPCLKIGIARLLRPTF
jgi:hypothetical protein